jgi:uncharacterized membrane protein
MSELVVVSYKGEDTADQVHEQRLKKALENVNSRAAVAA